MVSHLRLKAALGTAVMASSFATPLVAANISTASAATSRADLLSSLTSALAAAGVDTSTISSVESELSTLQSGGTTPLSGITSALGSLTGASTGLSSITSTPSGLGTVVGSLTGSTGTSTTTQTAINALTSAVESSGLTQLLSPSNASTGTVASAVSALTGLANLGQGATATGLGPVGSVLTSVLGGLPTSGASSSVVGAVTPLLTDAQSILNGSSVTPEQLTRVIADLTSAAGSLPSSSTLTGTLQGILGQLTGSGSLPAPIAGIVDDLGALTSNPSASQLTSLLGGLQGLTSLAPGTSSGSGALSGVSSLLTTIAGETGVSGTPAAQVLQTVASQLGSGAVNPSTLLSAFGALNGVSGLPAPLQSLLNNVTDALGGSGSLLGTIPGVSSSDQLGSLANLSALSGLVGGGTITGGLTPVANVLNTIAGESGVSGTPAATVLKTVASTLGAGNISPTTLTGLITQLAAAATTLPQPSAGQVQTIAQMLGASGTLLNGTSLDPGTLTSALGALSQLPGLSSGATLPSALATPIAALLTEIGNQSGVPAQVKTVLGGLATALQGPITPSSLLTVIKDLGVVGQLLPSPLSTAVEGLTGQLAGSGSLVGVPLGATSTATKTGTTSPVGVSATKPVTATKTGTSTTKSSAKKGPLKINGVRRSGKTLIVTVTCSAAGSAQCKSSVAAASAGHQIASRKVTLSAGRSSTVKLSLKKLPKSAKTAVKRHAKVTLRVTAKTGATKVVKSQRMLLG